MLIYQNSYKNVSVDDHTNSPPKELKQSASSKKLSAQLTRANTNFLRSLGFKVRQYKKLGKNE